MAVFGTAGFDTTEIRQFARQFAGADKIVMDELTTAFDRSGSQVLAAARGNINHWSGALSRGGTKRTTVSARQIVTLIEFIARRGSYNYAQAVEFGRGPVVAKRARFLRFQLRSGEVLFRKRVGPAKAQRFLGRAFESNRSLIDRNVDAAAARIVVRVLGVR